MSKIVANSLLAIVIMLAGCRSLEEKKAAANVTRLGNEVKVKEANDFLIEVATGVYREVELSRFALEKASLTKVREFAKNMITDYDKNIKGLIDLANRKKIEITLEESELMKEQMNKLSTLEGIEFDKAYISMMIDDHVEDIQKFRQQAEHGKDIETKAFAAGKLPILTHHLDMARTLLDSMLRS